MILSVLMSTKRICPVDVPTARVESLLNQFSATGLYGRVNSDISNDSVSQFWVSNTLIEYPPPSRTANCCCFDHSTPMTSENPLGSMRGSPTLSLSTAQMLILLPFTNAKLSPSGDHASK